MLWLLAPAQRHLAQLRVVARHGGKAFFSSPLDARWMNFDALLLVFPWLEKDILRTTLSTTTVLEKWGYPQCFLVLAPWTEMTAVFTTNHSWGAGKKNCCNTRFLSATLYFKEFWGVFFPASPRWRKQLLHIIAKLQNLSNWVPRSRVDEGHRYSGFSAAAQGEMKPWQVDHGEPMCFMSKTG